MSSSRYHTAIVDVNVTKSLVMFFDKEQNKVCVHCVKSYSGLLVVVKEANQFLGMIDEHREPNNLRG